VIEIGGNLAAAAVVLGGGIAFAGGTIGAALRKRTTREAELAVLVTEIRRLRDDVATTNRELESK
jgi:hypothetical protein